MSDSIINKSWGKGKFFSIRNMKPYWSKNGVGRQWKFSTNGSKKSNRKDTCLDVNIYLGYIVISYTDFNY